MDASELDGGADLPIARDDRSCGRNADAKSVRDLAPCAEGFHGIIIVGRRIVVKIHFLFFFGSGEQRRIALRLFRRDNVAAGVVKI